MEHSANIQYYYNIIYIYILPKILSRYCQFHAWWRSSDDKVYPQFQKKDLPNIRKLS